MNRGREEEKQRKTRSDKKVSAAPYIKDHDRMMIHRISRSLECPEGDAGSLLILTALQDEKAIGFFRQYFKRPYSVDGNHMMFPGFEPKDIHELLNPDKQSSSRFKVKFSKPASDQLAEFQIACGLHFFAHATKLLLEYALHDREIVYRIAPGIDWDRIRTTPVPKQPTGVSETHTVWSIFK